MEQQTIDGRWKQLKGRIQQRWGELTNDELDQFEGNLDELVGLIQERTGESRETVETSLAEISHSTTALGREAFASTSEMTHEVAAMLQRKVEEAAESLRSGYNQANQMVRTHPVESLAFSFAAGLVAGLTVGLVLRAK